MTSYITLHSDHFTTITIIPICCQYGSTVIKYNVLKLIFMFLCIMFKECVAEGFLQLHKHVTHACLSFEGETDNTTF